MGSKLDGSNQSRKHINRNIRITGLLPLLGVANERNNLSNRNHLDHDRHWRDVGLERMMWPFPTEPLPTPKRNKPIPFNPENYEDAPL